MCPLSDVREKFKLSSPTWMPMRIAFFTDSFMPLTNGVSVCVAEMARKLADRGHNIYIIAPQYTRAETFKYSNVTVIRKKCVPSPLYKGLKFTMPFDPALLNYMSDQKIDIIHFHTPLTLGMQAIMVAKILDIPLIGTFHTFFMDPQYLKHIGMNYRFMQKVGWKWSNVFYNRCDIVVCHSAGIRHELIEQGCKSRIKVIPLGIDLSVFDRSKSCDVRKALNRKGKIVLFVGRLAYEKNIFYLLECFALVLRKLPDTRMVIVGEGPQEKLVKAKIRALGIAKSVILTGRIEHDALVKSGIYGACDVFVNASTTETGPLTVLEAQANGLVCVSVEGHRTDLIKDNVNGIIVPKRDRKAFADAVVSLLTDAAKYCRLKKGTERLIRKRDIPEIIDELENVYKKVGKNS
jgi:1,2-diacylglycerol 3-alpha-glucosyltransferase